MDDIFSFLIIVLTSLRYRWFSPLCTCNKTPFKTPTFNLIKGLRWIGSLTDSLEDWSLEEISGAPGEGGDYSKKCSVPFFSPGLGSVARRFWPGWMLPYESVSSTAGKSPGSPNTLFGSPTFRRMLTSGHC